MTLIYLAGPISGLTYDGAVDWRNTVKETLDDASKGQIQCLSPMRHKDYLLNESKIKDDYEQILSSQRGITARDRFDSTRCDLLFVNFLGAKKVSIGTVLEIAWADSQRIPIVLVMEDENNPHEHSMVRELCPFRVNNLEEGIEIAYKILMP